MSPPVFFALPGNQEMATRLASACGGELGGLEVSRFPDAESHLRFAQAIAGRSIVLVCSLPRPDTKIPALLFAADAARDLGARRVGLVAPYLCYMRQDRRFVDGEAVTSKSFAALISRAFDWLATVEPHLHRYKTLDEIYSIPSRVVHAGPAIAAWILKNVSRPMIIGPDEESRQWVSAVAHDCDAPFLVLSKQRMGDRSVSITAPAIPLEPGRTPLFLDDIIASGVTMRQAIQSTAPASGPIVLGVHGPLVAGAAQSILSAGARLVTCNTVPNEFAAIDVSGIIAKTVADML
ncbi:MAG TPA: ribose-phosphate diphosphokinase [Rhizomicrobium sp.]|nr:ribose-phosphate diphosphokinase [Rhizomicrobium sp.]